MNNSACSAASTDACQSADCATEASSDPGGWMDNGGDADSPTTSADIHKGLLQAGSSLWIPGGLGGLTEHRDPNIGRVPIPVPPDNAQPSGYLLITADRLTELQQAVADQTPQWLALKQNVDSYGAGNDPYVSGPENVALVYLLTGQTAYASAAYARASSIVAAADVAFDSYLYFGDRMREIALVLNYAYDALTASERQVLIDYLDFWTNELWFNNQGSGWGLSDPGNNYHMAFLEGTAFAGYALRQAGHPNGQKYIDLLIDKIESPDGVLAYVDARAVGGDWPEGVNYGQRSKQRLFRALSVVASMGDDNYFDQASFFADSIYYAFYQLQPGGSLIYPAGDVARDSMMPLCPYDREIVQLAAYWLTDAAPKAFGQWYLENVVPDYTGPVFNLRPEYYMDMLYSVNCGCQSATSLPLVYESPGTKWTNVRSDWTGDATSLTIAGSPIIDQSHAHFDVGSFTLWKSDWLAVDATSYSHDGLNWDAGAHNMLYVHGHERRGGAVPGLTRRQDEAAFSYTQVDASDMFRYHTSSGDQTMVNEYTRELVYLKPDTLVVYDRVDPKPTGANYDWRVHFANQPTGSAGSYSAVNGNGAIALQMLEGGNETVLPDTDLVGGPSDAWRVQVGPSGNGRFMAILSVALGAPPTLNATQVNTTDAIDGLWWSDQVVVFSELGFGQTPNLPLSYTIDGTQQRTHTMVDIDVPCNVTVTKQNQSTTVTISAGSQYTPSPQGVLRFTS